MEGATQNFQIRRRTFLFPEEPKSDAFGRNGGGDPDLPVSVHPVYRFRNDVLRYMISLTEHGSHFPRLCPSLTRLRAIGERSRDVTDLCRQRQCGLVQQHKERVGRHLCGPLATHSGHTGECGHKTLFSRRFYWKGP